MAEELLGRILGQYELTEIVGEGKLATVYKGYQFQLNRWVAVKVLHSNDREMLARFEREAKAAARLHHPNILVVHEYGEEANWPYIAMQFVEQGSLQQYLQKNSVDWFQATHLAISLADALHYAHQHGLIHRDVKPSNILMPRPEWPLLADFGLVKMKKSEDEEGVISGSTSMILGTPSYVSPEQVKVDPVDARSDMYSLGVILFEMVTGQLPFDYSNENFLMWAHVSEPPPLPRELNPECPPLLEEIILTTLQKLSDDRYEDMHAMRRKLAEVVNLRTKNLHSNVPPIPTQDPVPGLEPVVRPKPTSNKPIPASSQQIPVPAPTTPKKPKPSKKVEARIRLLDFDATIELSAPSENGLIVGRQHRGGWVDIDLSPYEAVDKGVSRKHARFSRQDSQWFIEDLGSLNGTYVNTTKITPGVPVPLENGTRIRCSKLGFVFFSSSPPD